MFSYFKKIFSVYMNSNSKKEHFYNDSQRIPISSNIKDNQKVLQEYLGLSCDIIFRELYVGYKWQKEALLVYVDGMTDKNTINENIIKPLIYHVQQLNSLSLDSEEISSIKKKLVSVGEIKETRTLNEIMESCLAGDTVLLIDGAASGLIISARAWVARSIEEPSTEAVVRGPREGFTETIRSNTVLLRRKIHNPNLVIENTIVGNKTQTMVAVAYLRGVVNPELIKEIKKRLHNIDTDAILESGYIEEFIEDAPFSPFSTVYYTEKPDVTAAKILEGRAAIFIDGTPFVLTAPMLFLENFQSAEDYYSRPFYSSIIRMLRFLSFLISILAPATYVALTAFHHNIIPTPLLLTLASSREGTPFPAFVGALGMGITFEILREAGVRLPRPVGQAISIVGALVIGDAAVSAGLIDAPLVVIIALTAISSFVVPKLTEAGAILRIFLITFSGILGAFGILVGLLGTLIHLSTLRSFGAPYLSPITPVSPGVFRDTFIRIPLWAMSMRPRTTGWLNPMRQGPEQMPKPPQKNKK